jgi:hypothetical protein
MMVGNAMASTTAPPRNGLLTPRVYLSAIRARAPRRPSYGGPAIAGKARGCDALTMFPPDIEVLAVEYKINLMAPAAGDHIEAVGTVLKAERTLTVCHLAVFATDEPRRSLVALGQPILIRLPAQR